MILCLLESVVLWVHQLLKKVHSVKTQTIPNTALWATELYRCVIIAAFFQNGGYDNDKLFYIRLSNIDCFIITNFTDGLTDVND